jgi:hypothetical protein
MKKSLDSKMQLRRNFNMQLRRNQKGQLAVEAVLLMVLSIGIIALAMKFFKGNANGPVVSQLTQGPWARLSGMIQCGVWEPCGFGNPNPGKNPNTMARTLTLDPSHP